MAEGDHERHLRLIFVAATDYSTEQFRRKLNDCLSALSSKQKAAASDPGDQTLPEIIQHEHSEGPSLLIRALNAAHDEIHKHESLKVLLESLSDPNVIPSAFLCSTLIPSYIIPEYVQCKSASMNSNATVLLQHLLQWMEQFRCVASGAIAALRAASLASIHRRFVTPILVELYLHWFRSFPNLRLSILAALNDLLAEQYQYDAALLSLKTHRKRPRADEVTDETQQKKRKRRRLLDLNVVHDGDQSDDDDIDDETAHHRLRERSHGDHTSLSNVKKAKAGFASSLLILRTTADLCNRMMTLSSHYDALSPRCADVRSLVVSILLAGPSTMAAHAILSNENRNRHSIRLLCALMVVNFKPTVVMAACLRRCREHELLLFYVVELLTECRHYDDKRQLLAVVDRLSIHQSHSALWQCLCTKRGKLLEQTTNEGLRPILQWVNDNVPEVSSSLLNLRSTVKTIAPMTERTMRCPDDFFSAYSPANRVPPQEYTTKAQQTGNLSDECWFQIALFLNYKRVVKLRTVNSTMRRIVDNPGLWKRLYEIRYPPHVIDRTGAETLFRERIAAERSIRGVNSRGDASFRVHLCPLPGCLYVLTSRARAATHARSHHEKKGKKKPPKRKAATTAISEPSTNVI